MRIRFPHIHQDVYLTIFWSSLVFGFVAYLTWDPPAFYRMFVKDDDEYGAIDDTRLFTANELKLYNGVDRPQLYLVILGEVFDVTKNKDAYGPGQNYHTFVGRDNSRAFITGDFSEEKASDKTLDLTDKEILEIHNWKFFFMNRYQKVGQLIGRYFNEEGALTSDYGRPLYTRLEQANKEENRNLYENLLYPECNIEWSPEDGSKVWCTPTRGFEKYDPPLTYDNPS